MENHQKNVSSARQLYFPERQSVAIRAVQLGELQPNHLLVEALCSGVSLGTERLVFNGGVPKSEWGRMRCPNQEGEFVFPIAYGYANVSRVLAVGENCRAINSGDIIFALHPHQTHFMIEESAVTKVPEDIKPDIAVLAANAETALNAVWDADVRDGEKVLVLGSGAVGLLTAFMLQATTSANVTVCDINEQRAEICAKLGLKFKTVDELSEDEFSYVFHTTASQAGLQSAIEVAGFEGKIIEMSWYGEKNVTLALGGAFHSKRLQIISSQVGSVSPNQRTEFSHKQRLEKALSFLNHPSLESLLFPKIDFEELPDRLSSIFDPKCNAICPLITY